MRRSLTIAATAAISAVVLASQAQADMIVSGGSATFTFDSDVLTDTFLTTNWDDGSGVHQNTFNVRSGSSPSGTPSQVIPGGALLTFTGRGGGNVYLSPTNAAGEEIESFETVQVFPFFAVPEGITDAQANTNWLPTGNPNEFYDITDPSRIETFTPEQVAAMEATELRTCCTHTLGGFVIDTVAGTVDGIIDNIAERDVDLDGDIDADDAFHLFDLVDAGDGTFDLALTDVMASYLNFGFSEFGFLDAAALADWGNPEGALSFAGGDVVGSVAYSYTLEASPVPVPAALPLLAGGLGALGVVARRRRRTAA